MDAASYEACVLCPRACGVDRRAGARGVCGETAELRVASIGPHFGEEPCFTGTRGSGTVFFSGCACRCFFCQNWQISTNTVGRTLTPEAFAEEVGGMLDRGVHNLNFVTPDHFLPHIEDLLGRLKAKGSAPPVIFNTSGYQSSDRVDRQAASADIFLPDVKFADPELARSVMGDARYPELVFAALARMVEIKGLLHPFDPTGAETAKEGVLVRHLILPGEVENTVRVLERLRRDFGRWLPLSLMSQYHPVPACAGRGELARRVNREEYTTARACAESLGFEQIFLQDWLGDDAFLPDFQQSQPFPGNTRPPE
jgi:putative pyruvate formate lyase activating enzyme